MATKRNADPSAATKDRCMNYTALIKAINSASTQLQSRAAAAVNQALVLRNWLVGVWIENKCLIPCS